MSINFTGLPTSQTANTRTSASEQGSTANKGSSPASAQPPSGKGDTVNLSDAAQALQNVEKKLANTPDVDSDRVAQLRQEIESGTYQINARGTAEGIMNFEKFFG